MLYFAATLSILLGFTPSAQALEPRLKAEVDRLLQNVDGIGTDAISLKRGSERLSANLLQIKLDQFIWKDYQGAQKQVVPSIFSRRIQLRQKLVDLYQRNQLDEATARSVQIALRHLRGVEDYIGYVDSDQKKNKVPEQKGIRYLAPVVSGIGAVSLLPAAQTLVSPRFAAAVAKDLSELELRSGDLLLSRGTAATSSAIARLGDQDTQFSHVGMVYVDPKTKQAYTIEAHIELGVLAAPIEKWLTDGKKRTAVYRFQDAALARRAGELMYEYVAKYQREHDGANIPYDFGFDMNNSDEIFCSEVVRVAFDLASSKTVKVPMFPATLTPTNRKFLDQLGIQQTVSFIPADLEIDPRFSLIAEWRNFGTMKESWTSDAISTQVYEWMDRDGLSYDPTWSQGFAGRALTYLRRSWIKGVVKSRVAPNVKSNVVAVMLTIVSFYKKVTAELEKREASVLAYRGTPFTLFEATQQLELLRAQHPELFSKMLHK